MNSEATLFPLPELPKEKKASGQHYGKRRVKSPIRNQVVIRHSSLDDLLAEDHKVRAVWDYVQQLDLSNIFKKIQVVEGGVGRSAIDPYILLALWLYATVESIGSARVIAKFCLEHIAFQWLCGGVSVNYHTISDFRKDHGEELNELLTQSIAILMKQGLVELKRVSQDGVRVRASAGRGSFRREQRLKRYLEEAREHVLDLQKEIEEDPFKHVSKIEARRRQVILERRNRAEEAVKELANVRKEMREERSHKYSKKEREERIKNARVSKTDPEARKMKMANGGFSPAYNVQFATDTKSQTIVGVEVINAGCDFGQITPMLEQLAGRYKKIPAECLADAGYRTIEDMETASGNCKLYIPLRADGNVPEKESEKLKEWRLRMGEEEAKLIYRERCSTAECVNAIARNRGLQQFLVRGLEKVQNMVLLFAIAHNVMRGISLMSS